MYSIVEKYADFDRTGKKIIKMSKLLIKDKSIIIDNKILNREKAEKVSREIGYFSFRQLLNSYEKVHGEAFDGILIEWEDLK